MPINHVPTISCVNLRNQNLSVRYQNPRDMRFLRAGRLYFNNDVFSCAMVLLIIFLSKTRINFNYVNITYVHVTEFTLAEPT